MEVYIDDMLVESKKHFDHTKHLQEAFELLRKYNMKLNPSKCVFGVSSNLQKKSTSTDWLVGSSWAFHISFH